ncbi:aminodeoxychorismate lyase [Bacteroidia bacterium]|nr:aminodeoxychorismate lyase [Bacteroidia bacterium]
MFTFAEIFFKMTKKNILIGAGILLVIGLVLLVRSLVFSIQMRSAAFDIDKPQYIYIDNAKDYDRLLVQLDSVGHLKNGKRFKKVSERLNYPTRMKSGCYKIEPKMSYLEAVRLFRNGEQTPIKITFNNMRLKSDFVERISSQFMFSTEDLLALLNDTAFTAQLGFDTTTVLTLFIPNTYEFFWNIPAKSFVERMKKEYDRFWTPQRLEKAAEIPLSPTEVSILASIVEEETANRSEYPIVAGLYINRLHRGIALQADPTVKFAVGDVSLRRILNKHLKVKSPYNTYLHKGLPPGPIRVPGIRGIDGVLNYARHAYLYMCAKEDFSGTHNFAVRLAEHNRNARKYQTALNKLKITK